MTDSKTFDAPAFLKRCSRKPGVYRMMDSREKVIYVGKARDLKARLSSYFQKNLASIKTQALVKKIARIDTIVTQSEVEALLLEQTLIKELSPPYNILLRDDKTYPYIKITTQAKFPRAMLHRGKRGNNAKYYGPYPSVTSVRNVLNLMEKAFQLRNCSDSFFRNRTRPCLQHQIGRCTAPCVGYVTPEQYRQQVQQAMDFLEGRDDALVEQLEAEMETAAGSLEFEKAAKLRDRLAAIQEVRQKQYVDTGCGNLDVVALAMNHGVVVIELLMIRQGRVLGNRSISPKNYQDSSPEAIITAFLEQHYLSSGQPVERLDEVLVDRALPQADLLQEAISMTQGHKVRLAWQVRGNRQGFVRLATTNADNTLRVKLSQSDNLTQRFEAVAEILDCPVPERIECFDISHTGGKQAVASCVVAVREEGIVPRQYRKFNVTPDAEGDDYAALEEAVGRRLKRVTAEGQPLPNILLIDGGKGQISRIFQLLKRLELDESLLLLGISKGPSRMPGLEVLHFANGRQITPPADNPGLHLLQQVRDESHRFAITSHRSRRRKNISRSRLEDIPGIGSKRRRELLKHFGGLRGMRNASVEDIATVDGISDKLAAQIYLYLHGD